MISTLRLLLPALIPSWRFFKTIAPSPRVEWRADGAWHAFRPRPDHVSFVQMLARLFWNPDWNEALYAVSLAERLAEAPTDHARDEMFRLIAGQCPTATAIEFRVLFVTRCQAELLYRSPRRDLAERVT